MPSSNATAEHYNQLRVLAAQNPKAARLQFEALLNESGIDLDGLLTRMAAPGEGRLRQLVANLARSRPDRLRFAKYFSEWLAVETDQFARRAISAALEEPAPASTKLSARRQLASRDLVDMYRYVSERLRHELQNALLGPRTRILQMVDTIKRVDQGITKAELEALLGQLRDDFQGVGRLAEFEPDDQYFTVRPIRLRDWLDRLCTEYAKRYSRIDLRTEGSAAAKNQVIVGSDYLLRLVFWNLFINAHQAVGTSCTVTLHLEIGDDTLVVIVLDNGGGFSPEMSDVAFQDRFSSRGPNRGRGLLEIQDAIQQLHGDAELIEWRPCEYRVQLTFSTKQL